MIPEKTLECYRGDQGGQTEYAFRHSSDPADVVEIRFYIRQAIDGPVLVALRWSDKPAQFALGDKTVGVSLLAADTDGRPAGDWRYDVELTHADGGVVTIQRGIFRLIGDIATDAAFEPPPDGLSYVSPAMYQLLANATPDAVPGTLMLRGAAAEAASYHLQPTSLPAVLSLTIPAAHQMIAYGAFAVNGELIAEGDLVVIGG